MDHWNVSREGWISRLSFETSDGKQRLSPAILVELGARVRQEAGRSQRVVAIRSSSRRLFASGADLATIRDLAPTEAFRYARAGQEALASFAEVPAFLIAEVEGACFGGAFDLILACDIRLACERAAFSHPGPRLGIITGWGGTRLAREVAGIRAARHLFFDGRVLRAPEARSLGLIDRVFREEHWPDACRDVEERLASEEEPIRIKALMHPRSWPGSPS
jgi:enoyl-CoA hydratase